MSNLSLAQKSIAKKYRFLRPWVSQIDGWTKGVDRSLPASGKQRVRRKFSSQTRTRIGLILTGLAVCFGIAYWLSAGEANSNSRNFTNAKIGSFEEVVGRSNQRQLLGLYKGTIVKPMSTVLKRVAQLEKRKTIAGLLALASEGTEKDEWIASYIDNSIQKEMLLFIKDVKNPNSKTELESIGTRFGGNSPEVVTERVGLANFMNAFLSADKRGETSSVGFLQQYQKAAQVYSSNIPDIKLLYDIAQHSLDTKGNAELLECFASSFDSNPAASGLSKLAASAVLNSELAGGAFRAVPMRWLCLTSLKRLLKMRRRK